LYDVLASGLSGLEVYRDGIPRIGAKIPSVAITHVSGSSSSAAFADRISALEEGENVRIRLQIDVFHTSQRDLDTVSDTIMKLLFNAKNTLEAAGVLKYHMIVCSDVAPEEATARNEYRKLIDYEFTLERKAT
jgi:hypothetical protein